MDDDLMAARELVPGVWRLRSGEPEAVTPVGLFEHTPAAGGLGDLPRVKECPVRPKDVTGGRTARGYLVRMPLARDEQVYGLGLQLQSFNQRGKKKTLRVNSDPLADTGDSHAPVPFFVTTSGYGVLVDSLRYVTVYCGGAARRGGPAEPAAPTARPGPTAATGSQELYQTRGREGEAELIIEVPRAPGVDLYLFAGPGMREAVQRYNLFSGGGCMPPRWGLGVWYRCKSDYTAEAVIARADSFRAEDIPCDVLGLEPGWQTRAYSCSHVWSHRFPDPARTTAQLRERGVRLNLWTHAFIHPVSPLHERFSALSGDYLVWNGLVPDFADPEARRRFADFYEAEHVEKGVSGYKLDECDNSDFIAKPWSFPEFSRFPSGLDGEQMHSAYGMLFQQAVQAVFDRRNQRTYGEARSAYALAAPLPYVSYSDLYDATSFIRGVATSGFCGLLWSPEVRDAGSAEDLIRRVQAVVFSPQALINAWYIKNPPWEQWVTEANNADTPHPERAWVTGICRDMLQLRMRFLPYLYAAFVDYHRTGMPPFRALVMDDPADPELWGNDLCWMMGDRVLVAPVVAGEQARDVYLPKGGWRDFWTGKRIEGGRRYRMAVPIDRILVFIKDDCILPLAGPAAHAADPRLRQLTVHVWGTGARGIALYEDDGETLAYRAGEVNRVDCAWDGGEARLTRSGKAKAPEYGIVGTVLHGA
jgi:alpha-D-xyloside xylohydrolase